MRRVRLLLASAVVSLAAVLTQGQGQSGAAADLEEWEPDIRAFEEADRAAPPPPNGILFVGSSSIRLWEALGEDFEGLPVINRGFGGSKIHEVNAFVDRIVLPYRPRLIVFYCGTNDIAAGLPVMRVVNEYKRFVRTVHEHLPGTGIAFIAAAPNPARWHLRESMQRLNREVAAFSRTDRRLDYLDVWHPMLGPNGKPRPDIFGEDRLHMNEKGYEIWKQVIGRYLQRAWRSEAA